MEEVNTFKLLHIHLQKMITWYNFSPLTS